MLLASINTQRPSKSAWSRTWSTKSTSSMTICWFTMNRSWWTTTPSRNAAVPKRTAQSTKRSILIISQTPSSQPDNIDDNHNWTRGRSKSLTHIGSLARTTVYFSHKSINAYCSLLTLATILLLRSYKKVFRQYVYLHICKKNKRNFRFYASWLEAFHFFKFQSEALLYRIFVAN